MSRVKLLFWMRPKPPVWKESFWTSRNWMTSPAADGRADVVLLLVPRALRRHEPSRRRRDPRSAARSPCRRSSCLPSYVSGSPFSECFASLIAPVSSRGSWKIRPDERLALAELERELAGREVARCSSRSRSCPARGPAGRTLSCVLSTRSYAPKNQSRSFRMKPPRSSAEVLPREAGGRAVVETTSSALRLEPVAVVVAEERRRGTRCRPTS